MSDERTGQPLLAVLIKASFSIGHQKVYLAKQQAPVLYAGEYWGSPDGASYKYEPEIAFFKPATDIVLVGHAYTSRSTIETLVGFQVGALQKIIRVTGDRYWIRSLGMVSMTPPRPFDMIPLVYERAFGGWDRSLPDIGRHTFEPRNPVGTGYRDPDGRFEEGIKLPNLEHLKEPIRQYNDRPSPVGFGFISPHWQPRAALAGTYDDRWRKERMPLLPVDFDRRFFNGAPHDQVVSGYLKGDEPVIIKNASPSGSLTFHLPGIRPPACTIRLRDNRSPVLYTRLDTLIINTDENVLFLFWRAYLPLKNGPHDVLAIHIQPQEPLNMNNLV